jgi:hypothetical protein
LDALAVVTIVAVPTGLGLTVAALPGIINSPDPLQLGKDAWIGEVLQAVFASFLGLALLGLGLALDDTYLQRAAIATAGIEAVSIWIVWLIAHPSRRVSQSQADASSVSSSHRRHAAPSVPSH